jgi:PhzF family phenazine biosynthesis protein
MAIKFTTLDVFTEKPYEGNPLAVMTLPATGSGPALTQKQKQAIAKEFNLSESTFIYPDDTPGLEPGDVKIDIFTVGAEINFAGHPTIGTANYLIKYLQRDVKRLITRAGPIPIAYDGARVSAAIPHNVHVHEHAARTLGQTIVSIVKGMSFIMVEHADLASLGQPTNRSLKADIYDTAELDEGWHEGLVGTYHFVRLGSDGDGTEQLRTRMFGSREDPATGSAASALTSWLSMLEAKKLGKPVQKRFVVTQGVEMGRKSVLELDVATADDREGVKSVTLRGAAVTVMSGTLEPPVL